MRCENLTECREQIRAYAEGASTGYPLIVDAQNFHDYQEIMNWFSAEGSKQFVFVSHHTFANGLPNVPELLQSISEEGNYVVAGISQSLMLQGASALDAQIDELIELPISGHAIILLSHCRVFLEKYMQRDTRLDRRILLLEGEKSSLPQICIAKSKDEIIGSADEGVKALLAHLERITDAEIAARPMITAITSFSPAFFKNSMYSISGSGGIYDVLLKKFPDLAAGTEKSLGTDANWFWLLNQAKTHRTFSDLVSSLFGRTSELIGKLGETLEAGDDNTKWLLWLAMKVFGVEKNAYLSGAISRCNSYTELTHHIYQDLLDVSYGDDKFEASFEERKHLIARLPENLPEIIAYCKNVGRHGKNAVYYLTDATEDEEFAFMETVDHYSWTEDELTAAVQHAFPELSLYLTDFVFDSMNTMLSEKDAPFRNDLTNYFHRYKIQKLSNHIKDDFLADVNQYAIDRPFYKLQPRSAIVSAMGKEKVQAYFFDALGVEYLAYIQAKCEQYGLILEISIGHCELPSITVKNKEFQNYFDTKDIRELDELKHHSQIYDYQKCPYPIHIFRELEIIDRELRRIRSQLIQNDIDKAVILSDHGASRLAVIYKHENDSKLELEENGVHSGRCCPCSEDPEIPQAAYEDGFAVLGNYERFKGSRKANLEVHGGASLEEVVVPVITIALRPDDVVYHFVDTVVKFKIGQTSTIELFSNAPMKHPKIEVDGEIYEGVFQKDKNHAVFELKKQKQTREYTAIVYEGNTNTGVTLKFRIERNTKTRDLFGLN